MGAAEFASAPELVIRCDSLKLTLVRSLSWDSRKAVVGVGINRGGGKRDLMLPNGSQLRMLLWL